MFSSCTHMIFKKKNLRFLQQIWEFHAEKRAEKILMKKKKEWRKLKIIFYKKSVHADKKMRWDAKVMIQLWKPNFQ